MAAASAGILLYRHRGRDPEIFLIHPGGPYWRNKDHGAWSLPKGLVTPDEDPFSAALREFAEETGFRISGSARYLGPFRQPGGKQLTVWAIEGEADPHSMVSKSFSLEWPPKSGQVQIFPEADRGAWLGRDKAMIQITKGQRPILEAFFAQMT